EHLLELPRIGLHVPEILGAGGPERDALADQTLEHPLHALDERAQVHRAWIDHLLAPERQELARQGRRALRRRARALEVLAGPSIGLAVLFGEREVSHDAGEEIVEIVRDASRQAPDRLHLLGLSELRGELRLLFLRVLTLRHVEAGAEDAD